MLNTSPQTVATALERLKQQSHNDSYRLMEFCGGHTHALHRHGLIDQFPSSITMVHGPGCPVCVLAEERIDAAITVAETNPNVMLCAYGDLLKAPGSQGRSLLNAKASGIDVALIYAPGDALTLAQAHPNRHIILFAIGFETTAPATAQTIIDAERIGVTNFSVYNNHVTTPGALTAILGDGDDALDGLLAPGHVSVITGSDLFLPYSTHHPIVISGFEAYDMIIAITMLVEAINKQQTGVFNAYCRAVSSGGNSRAQIVLDTVFTLRPHFRLRGLGAITKGGFAIAPAYAAYDAETQFDFQFSGNEGHRNCLCGLILKGRKQPHDCRLFGTACHPDHPLGPCMVSSEGACAAHFQYRPTPPLRTMNESEIQ